MINKGENCESFTFKNEWIKFSDHTTFHGLNNIFINNVLSFRRIFWIIIIFITIFLFTFQVALRSVDFATNEASINVEIIYTDKLEFPSVTICNQNRFRQSKLIRFGYFKFITSFYKENKNNSELFLLASNFTKFDVNKIKYEAAHQAINLFLECSWIGEKCPQKPTPILTDMGLCYNFNNTSIKVRGFGLRNSLSLSLNIEQYEYIHGIASAGFKIFFHNNHARPLVLDLGFSISPGKHTLLGLKRVESHYLKPPFGNCGDTRFKSHKNCMDFCKMEKITEICQCRSKYFLKEVYDLTNITKNCTFFEEFNCIEKHAKTIKETSIKCNCYKPCSLIEYEPFISSLTFSKYNLEQKFFKHESTKSNMEKDLLKSLENSELLYEDKRNFNYEIFQSFIKKFRFFLINYEKFSFYIQQTNKSLDSVFTSYEKVLKNDLSIIRNQIDFIINIRNSLTDKKFFYQLNQTEINDEILQICNKFEKELVKFNECFEKNNYTYASELIMFNCFKLSNLNINLNKLKKNNYNKIIKQFYKIENIFDFYLDKLNHSLIDRKIFRKISINCMNNVKNFNNKFKMLKNRLEFVNNNNNDRILSLIYLINKFYKLQYQFKENNYCNFNIHKSKEKDSQKIFYKLKLLSTKCILFDNRITDSGKIVFNLGVFQGQLEKYFHKNNLNDLPTKKYLWTFLNEYDLLHEIYELRNLLFVADNFLRDFNSIFSDIYNLLKDDFVSNWNEILQPLPENLKHFQFIIDFNLTCYDFYKKYSTLDDYLHCYATSYLNIDKILSKLTIKLRANISKFLTAFIDVRNNLQQFSEASSISEKFFKYVKFYILSKK